MELGLSIPHVFKSIEWIEQVSALSGFWGQHKQRAKQESINKYTHKGLRVITRIRLRLDGTKLGRPNFSLKFLVLENRSSSLA